VSDGASDVDVLIIGGGAAGLFCALTAGARGRRARVLEHAPQVGRKILMSGGGRCNFTNLHTGPGNYLSRNPHFCKSALARFTPADFIAMVDAHRIAWHEKELGQLFCDESSKPIVRMLVDRCVESGVDIRTRCEVGAVRAIDGGGFVVETSQGSQRAASLVIASGGLSIPKMGATGIGYRIARQFGHDLIETRAGLVPLTLSGATLAQWSDLSGASFDAVARCPAQAFTGPVLLTHRGLSGPAILQLSNYWQEGEAIDIDLLPGHDAADWLDTQRAQRPDAELRTVLAEILPRRVAQRIAELSGRNGPMRRLDPGALKNLAQRLSAWEFRPSGTEGYRTAEVTLGGVDTRELDSKTMMSKRQPALHFIGEVVDVTGWLGGYNFQWAWASGRAAGEVA